MLNDLEERTLTRMREALHHEARAIAAQEAMLDADFLSFAAHVAMGKGTLYVAGIGKSGFAGQLIASTLASIGLPSVYMDPVGALHGELGRIREGDTVLCLSNSGKTEELLAFTRAARARGARVAAMVGRNPSPLTRDADWVLHARLNGEATPVKLPTSSVVSMIAAGHALAVYAIEARGFGHQDYADIHPGGMLGVVLGSRVDDIMHRPPRIPVLHPESSMHQALIEMTTYPLGAAVVVDDAKHIVGILTDGDIRRALQKNAEGFLAERVGTFMSPEPILCQGGSRVLDALKLMEEGPRKVYVLPVVDPDMRLLGMIRTHDIIGLELESDKKEAKS